MKRIEKYIFEVRFSPTASILDKRGVIAENLMSDYFDSWRIDANTIEISKREDRNFGALFGYKRMVVAAETPKDQTFFIKIAKDFLKKAWTFIPFHNVVRIGVRSRYLIETENFENAVGVLKSKLSGLAAEDIGRFGGELIDVSFPMNFKDGSRNFDINIGIMKKEQSEKFFIEEELPQCGVFIDVDYFEERGVDGLDSKQRNFLEFIDDAVEKGNEIQKIFMEMFKE